MKIKTYTVDSFTSEPFKGNPAGVCLPEEALPEELMLKIAQELGLSETAYVRKIAGGDKYSIRYFSPAMEIPLCGHATLAAAKVLFQENFNLNKVVFVTAEGLDLVISKVAEKIRMVFPIYETNPAEAPVALLEALGVETIINAAYNKETNILLLEIAEAEVLQNLAPDFAALVGSHDKINGILVTAPSRREGFDFESRYFWPWSGTNEDPVTGGTHTFLTKYWAERLGKKKMRSFQCSARTGFMEVELMSDTQFTITSQAVIIFEGQLHI